MNLSLTQKGLLLVSVPLVFEIGFVCYLCNILEKANREIARQEHARAIEQHMNSLTRKLVDAGTTAGSYSCPVFLGNYNSALATTAAEFEGLEGLTRDNPEELRIVKQVELLADEGRSLVSEGRSLLAKGQLDSANELLVNSLKPLVGRLNAEAALLTEQAKVTEKNGPEARARMATQVRATLVGGIALNILVAISLAVFFMKNMVRKVERVVDNTFRLAKRQTLNPPLQGNDEIAHLDRVLRDMAAALEASSRKERAIFQNARDMICTIADGGVFSNVSPACAEILGYEPDELEGKWFVELVEENQVNKTIELLKRLFKGECDQPFDTRMKRKDGTLVDLLWSAQWSAQENCLFCVAHDISERIAIERMKQDFIAMVSHDLRTPLTSVQGYLDLLYEGGYGEITDNARVKCEMASRNVSRLIDLINDILDAEKLESGKFEFRLTEVKLKDVLQRSVDAVRDFADKSNVTIEIDPGDAETIADGERLVQVVINLLSNAIKFSPAGSAVTLSVKEMPKYLEVSVCDRGAGIPEDYRQLIFERFGQVRGAKSRHKGSGLGLTICKKIVEQHNGTIGVDSVEGEGSRFWFRLPKVLTSIAR